MTIIDGSLNEEDVLASILSGDPLIFSNIDEFLSALPAMISKEWLVFDHIYKNDLLPSSNIELFFKTKYPICLADSAINESNSIYTAGDRLMMRVMSNSKYYNHYQTMYDRRKRLDISLSHLYFCVPVKGIEDMYEKNEKVRLEVIRPNTIYSRPEYALTINVMGKAVSVRLTEDVHDSTTKVVPGCEAISMDQIGWAKEQIARALQNRAIEVMQMDVEVKHVDR